MKTQSLATKCSFACLPSTLWHWSFLEFNDVKEYDIIVCYLLFLLYCIMHRTMWPATGFDPIGYLFNRVQCVCSWYIQHFSKRSWGLKITLSNCFMSLLGRARIWTFTYSDGPWKNHFKKVTWKILLAPLAITFHFIC